jgi:hypothetical protein
MLHLSAFRLIVPTTFNTIGTATPPLLMSSSASTDAAIVNSFLSPSTPVLSNTNGNTQLSYLASPKLTSAAYPTAFELLLKNANVEQV